VKPSKNTLIIVLVFAVATLAAFSWTQYRELIDLRAKVADGDMAALKKQLADARKAIKSLEDRIAAMRGRRGGGASAAGDTANGDTPGGPNGGRDRPGGRFGMFAQLNANPEFQRLLALQMKGRLSETYGPLFKSLNLTPDQLAQFQTLLADKQQALMDTLSAAREQGINPRTDPDGFKTLVNQATSQVDTSIQQALGDAGYQQYQQYQQTLPERNTVNALTQQLSYTQTPLTDDEANSMVQLLAQNQPQRAGNGTSGTTNGGDGGPNLAALLNGGGNAKITPESVTAAQGVLSAPQMTVLQQVQAQQQAQQQIQQMIRSANQGNAGAQGATGTAPASGSGGSKG
jgi:hypothetical protein